MQVKAKWHAVTHQAEMLKLKMVTTPGAGKDEEKLKQQYTAGENVKWYNHFENSLIVSYRVKHTLIWHRNSTPKT